MVCLSSADEEVGKSSNDEETWVVVAEVRE